VALTSVGEVEYRFATDVMVSRPAEMVYLEFIQRDRERIVPSASPESLLIPVSWPISSSSRPQCRARPATRVVSVFRVGRDEASVGL
jgi:hypothetical protein